MRIRDLAAGTDLPDRLEGTYYGTAWSADERYLFYTRPDHAMRPYQVWRHEMGTAQGDDVLVYEEPDERYNVDLELCRSGVLRHHHQRGQHLDRRARAPRHPAAGRAAARGRAPAGRRVPAGPLGRPLRHPHQPRRPGLQGRHRALRQPGAGRVGRPRAPPGRAPHHAGRAVRRPPRAARVVRRARAHPHPPQRRLRADAGLRRPGPLRRHRRQPRVPHADGPLHLRVPGDAALGLRRGRLDRRPPAAQAGPGARRATTLPTTTRLANGRPRPTARGSPSTSSGSGARPGTAPRRCRSTATAPTSTRGRRGSRSSACRSSTAAASGPSPTPVAAASSAGPGTSTASSSTSATPSPTSSPAPSTWSSRATARRTGSRPAAAAPVACSSGPASPSGPSSTPA